MRHRPRQSSEKSTIYERLGAEKLIGTWVLQYFGFKSTGPLIRNYVQSERMVAARHSLLFAVDVVGGYSRAFLFVP